MEKKIVSKKTRMWSNLEPDILSLIKSRLIVSDVTTFNMICKPWRSITSFSSPRMNSSTLGLTPCLLTLYENTCEFYQPFYNVTYKLDTPELCGARIKSTGYGWLLVIKGDKSIFFFNPFTKEKIDLPDDSFLHISPTINFSSPPTSPDCCVIGRHPTPSYRFINLMPIERGEASWADIDQDNGRKKFMMSPFCSPVFSNGKWYFLGETGNICVFDIKEKDFDILGKWWPSHKRASLRATALVMEDDGRFLAVFLTREKRHVCILRFDTSKMEWEDVESLGNDKMLYVCDGASFLETTIGKGMGNKIYFPKSSQGSTNCFIYCLSTKNYISFDGKYFKACPFGLGEQPHNTWWFKPVYTASDHLEELKWY